MQPSQAQLTTFRTAIVSAFALPTLTAIAFTTSAFALPPAPPLEKILVTDFMNGRILQFSPTGTLLGTFGQANNLNGPTSLIVDSQSRVYVINAASGHVIRYSRSGQLLGPFATIPQEFSRGLDFDAAGNLYLRGGGVILNRIMRFSPSGALLNNFNTQLQGQADIAIGPDGNLFVPEDQFPLSGPPPGNTIDAIIRMSPTGTNLGLFGQASSQLSGLRDPTSAAFDSSGILHVVVPGFIYRYNSAGTYLGNFPTEIAGNLTFDAAGNFYGTDGSEDAVLKYDPNGHLIAKLLTAGQGGLPANFRPEGITFLYQVPEFTTATLAAIALVLSAPFHRRRNHSHVGHASAG